MIEGVRILHYILFLKMEFLLLMEIGQEQAVVVVLARLSSVE